jgi:hypothetical protein
MRGENPATPTRARQPFYESNWIVAPGALLLIASVSAWIWLLNITWSLFFPLLIVVFIPLFWLARREIGATAKTPPNGPVLPAIAALLASVPFAVALIAPVDMVNRFALTQPAPASVRVIKIEQKSDWYGRSSRQFQYYTFNLADDGRDEILLRSSESSPRFLAGQDVSICQYRGWLGYPVYGLPPCNQTYRLE